MEEGPADDLDFETPKDDVRLSKSVSKGAKLQLGAKGAKGSERELQLGAGQARNSKAVCGSLCQTHLDGNFDLLMWQVLGGGDGCLADVQ